MNIDISGIVSDKLEQLNNEGVIKSKIEDALEKSILDAITSELSSYSFRNEISKQVRESISNIAADCGFSAYNGFIAERVKAIVREMLTDDISQKIHETLNETMLKKYENIKLSDIFKKYRDWVLKNTEDEDKYEREKFTSELEIREDGCFTRYVCKFADHPLDKIYYEKPDIEIRILVYQGKKTSEITSIYLSGHNVADTVKLGYLSEFEAFIVNLHYNKTEIIIDPDDVDDSNYFDIGV